MVRADRGGGVVSIQDQSTIPRRRLTADYYPLVARAVASLKSDEDARAEVYERARQSLYKHLRSMEPPFSGAEVAAELWALEQAIQRLEAAATDQSTNEEAPAMAELARAAAIKKRAATEATAPHVAHQRDAGPAVVVRPDASTTTSGSGARTARTVILIVGTLLAAGLAYFGYRDGGIGRGSLVIALQQFVTAFVMFAVPPLYLVSVLRRRKRLHQAGLIKHRVRAFAWKSYKPEARREIAQKLDDRALQWAYFLPDHTTEAKAIVATELERRGRARAHIDSWLPSAAELTVPPAVDGAMTTPWYGALKRQKVLWLKLFRLSVIVLASLMVAGIAVAIAASLVTAFAGAATGTNKWIDDSTFATVALYTLLTFWLASPFLVGFLYRNRALRILLLRPFGEKRMTRALKQFVPRNLGNEGYVFTLSDRNYKPSVLMAILVLIPLQGFDVLVTFILGPLLRNSTRISSVRNERKFRRLAKFLLRKYRPSIWSFLGGGQAFNIRTTDPWWQMCIHMLMHSCEVIVVDLSKVKEGTAWELNQLRTKAILDKCVFVVGDDHVSNLWPVMERYFPAGQWPTVHVYGNDGCLADQAPFDARLGEIMAAGIAGWGR